ncbi:MAG: ferritin-like domain-containing protein [Anaerolineales bacterium]
MQNLHDLYVEQLRDVYNAENQLTQALPKMAKAAQSDELQRAFEQHLDQTKTHVQRLESIFNSMGISPQGETCEAMQGLIEEGEEIISKDGDRHVKDAALIAAAQRVEHYEIAVYGTLCAFAKQLGRNDEHETLNTTLHEEKNTDSELNDLALGSINKSAQTS